MILTANKLETSPIVSKLQECKILKGLSLKVWEGKLDENQVIVCCSGIGNNKIGDALTLFSAKRVINIGIAGALNEEYKIGAWARVSCLRHGIAEKIVISEKGVNLLTVEEAVFNHAYDLAQKYDSHIVDMEGYYIAQICKSKNIDLIVIKMISDYANIDSKVDYKVSIKIYSESCMSEIKKIISEYRK